MTTPHPEDICRCGAARKDHDLKPGSGIIFNLDYTAEQARAWGIKAKPFGSGASA